MDEVIGPVEAGLLSIVIPTRDRQEVCAATVRAILSYEQFFELLIYDTGAGPGLVAALPADERLRVIRGSPEQNITQCFESAASLARGDLICMIGDDDGVTPALFEWARRARSERIESLSTNPNFYALYNWPDIRSRYFGSAVAGKLYLRFTPTAYRHDIDLTSELRTFLRNAAQGCGMLPRIYHGLVSMEVLRRMRARFGCCFAGVSPDVSFSFLAGSVARNHVLVSDPLTISGSSGASNAGRSAMRTHKGDLWTDPHMLRFRGEHWPTVVPEFFSVETVWAQAGLCAAELVGQGAVREFGKSALLAKLLVKHFDRRADILRSLSAARAAEVGDDRVSTSRFAWHLLVATAETGWELARKLARKAVPDRRTVVIPSGSIADATRVLKETMKGNQ